MNYYVILGVPRTAELATIRSAFRGLVRQYHPDAGAGSSAHRFQEIVEAYETLSDPERRRRYDASLRPRSRPVRVEPLTQDYPEPLFQMPRSSPVADRWAYHQDIFELVRMIDELFRDF
jgi:curved DNA-binding protein CbpA